MTLVQMPLRGRPQESGRAPQAVRQTKLAFRSMARVLSSADGEILRGSSASRLMRADDGFLYVVKLKQNPYGARILVNEYLAARLATALGLPVPESALIRIVDGATGDVSIHFGSRLLISRFGLMPHDWIPESVWSLVQNPKDLIGAFVFDTWAGNADERQVLFARRTGFAPYRLFLIDNAHCFGGPTWRLNGLAPLCPTRLRFAYRCVSSWADLEPWLSVIERLDPAAIQAAANGLPAEWLNASDRTSLETMLKRLAERCLKIRGLIASFLNRGAHPFTSWRFRASLYTVPRRPPLGRIA